MLQDDINEFKHCIYQEIVDHAKMFWSACPNDFCIQTVGYDSIVFGGWNRVVWHYKRGFRVEVSHSTQEFVDHFNEVMR